MDIKELENILNGTKYEAYIGHIDYVELNGYKYNDLFKAGNANIGFLAFKIRENDNQNRYAVSSIENIAVMKDKDNFINKYKDIIEKDEHILIVSEWLNGFQPIQKNRENLPQIFSLLAEFNKQNIAKENFTSMYAYGNHFGTIDDLVNWEINYHKKYFQEIIGNNEILDTLNYLKDGLACIILEDMNTGNLFITDDGKYKYIDMDWIINGLNLYQFEKIDYFGFEERQNYNINAEVKECYIAYFETLGIKKEEANN
jgi:serine/threonine protein kinase